MRLFALSLLSAGLLVSLSACDGAVGDWSDSSELSVGTDAIVAQVAVAHPGVFVDGLLPSPIVGPDRVSIFAGDQLSLNLELVDPTTSSLVAIAIPSGANFSADSLGGILTWTPETSDVGNYRLIFYSVDRDDSESLNGVAAIDLSVLPRFGLIEYGF